MTENDKHNYLLTLVSRGVPMKEARERIYGSSDAGPKGEAIRKNKQPEAPTQDAKPEAPTQDAKPESEDAPTGRYEEVVDELRKLGQRVHPSAKLETLEKKLEEARSEDNDVL